MEIVNRTRIDGAIVRNVAQRSTVAGERFIVFLDNAVNAVRADFARGKLQEYRQKGWKFIPAWEKDATGENDIHACTVSRCIISSQQLPPYVIEAIGTYELLVYLDATWTGAARDGIHADARPRASPCVAVLQRAGRVSFADAVVMGCPAAVNALEPDAEKASKARPSSVVWRRSVRIYLETELARCKLEHREVLEHLAALDETADPKIEAETITLLEQHAAEIRKCQLEYKFVIPGIPELSEALRGRTDARLAL
jgi:hypothetical protein